MNKKPFLFACAATLSLLATATASQTSVPSPKFVSEAGVITPLSTTGATDLSPYEVGEIRIGFVFQSQSFDQGANLWTEPDLVGAYKLKSDQGTDSWYASKGVPFYFGTGVKEIPATILTFNPATGAGVAELACPLRLDTRSTTWGFLFGGLNTMTCYWGESSDLLAGPFVAPLSPWGAETFSLNGVLPSVSLALATNRGMSTEGTYTAAIILDSITLVDRTFSLASTVPAVLEPPAQVTVLAGKQSVLFQVVADDAGTATLEAAESGNPVAVSEIGVVHRRLTLEPWDFVRPADIQSRVERFNSRCIPAKALGLVPAGSQRQVCLDDCTPNATCLPSIPSQDGFKAYEPFDCTWFSLFRNCNKKHQSTSIPVQQWVLESAVPTVCSSRTIGLTAKFVEFDLGLSNTTYTYTLCCVYVAEAANATDVHNVEDCS